MTALAAAAPAVTVEHHEARVVASCTGPAGYRVQAAVTLHYFGGDRDAAEAEALATLERQIARSVQ